MTIVDRVYSEYGELSDCLNLRTASQNAHAASWPPMFLQLKLHGCIAQIHAMQLILIIINVCLCMCFIYRVTQRWYRIISGFIAGDRHRVHHRVRELFDIHQYLHEMVHSAVDNSVFSQRPLGPTGRPAAPPVGRGSKLACSTAGRSRRSQAA